MDARNVRYMNIILGEFFYQARINTKMKKKKKRKFYSNGSHQKLIFT